MRVSLLAEQLLQEVPGGIGTYVRALIRYLPSWGIEVEPVVAWHGQNEMFEAGLSQARRLRLPRAAAYKRWTSGRGPQIRGGGELVHAPSLAIPRKDSRPLVVTVHDVLFLDFPDAYPASGVSFHTAMLRRLQDADAVIVPSEATAVRVREKTKAQPVVVPMGTEFAAPDPGDVDRVLDRLEVRRPYVLWCGTVEPRKNPEGVIHGFVSSVESGVPASDELALYLVGPPGWWSGDVGEFLEEHGMTDRVRRLGAQPPAVRAALYAGAEAFLFPSLAEGFGLPVVEAMACGAPVVTSDRSSLPEVAGDAAVLCDPDDEDSIGRALSKILRDPALAADLRARGFARASQFTWDRTARETAAVYRGLLG
ncbi:MAG TPA: glycosyltransferase family 1 protein [Actinomycetota bacterium]|nr:glycosyltransferase family 1 protein [Actinomycetota bacterium]